jgi:hypothetical protein
MIRVRDVTGKVLRCNPEDTFVELCNDEGKVVAVFYENQGNGEIHQLTGDGNPHSEKYADMFGIEFLQKKIVLPK